MRAKGAPLDLVAQRLARDLDVVVQELELRRRLHAQPYDAGLVS